MREQSSRRDYAGVRRLVTAASAAALFVGLLASAGLAHGTYGEAHKIGGGGYNEYTFVASTHATDAQDSIYQFATGTDGKGYYAKYGGTNWTDLGDNYAYDPFQYIYADGLNLTYTGADGYVYYKTYAGGESDSGY
jgi:hypothetical protein